MSKFFKIFFASLIFTGSIANLRAQDDEMPMESTRGKAFYFGINTGALLANKYPASYYNGNGEYSVFNLLYNTTNTNEPYDQVYNIIQKDFYVGEMPAEVKYRPAINVGFHAGIYTDEYSSFFTNIDFILLKTSAPMALYADDPANPSGDPVVYPETIIGEENRFHLDLGYHSDFSEDRNRGYAEFGFNMNAVRPSKNVVVIEGLQYNLLQNQYNPNPWMDRGGVGFGCFLGSGIRMKFNDKFTFDIGGSAYYQRVNLGPEKFRLSALFYLRLLYL